MTHDGGTESGTGSHGSVVRGAVLQASVLQVLHVLPTRRSSSRRSYFLFLLALALLAADVLWLPLSPGPWQLVRPGLLGALMQPLLVVAAVLALHAAKGGTTAGGRLLAAPLALLLVPMVWLDGWVVPAAEIARFAGDGSVDGMWGLGATVAVFLPALVVLVAGVESAIGRWSAWVLACAVALLPWAAVGMHAGFYSGAATARVAGSAVLETLALALLWLGWRPGTEEAGAASEWLDAVLAVVPVAALLALYVVVKTETLSYSTTDENIYFYDALLFAQGKMPYRDFFFAHPPVHLLIPGFLVMLFGPGFTMLKLIPVAFSAASGLSVYLAASKHAGRAAGLLSAGIFLFALEQLQASTNLTGINITVGFLCMAAACVVRGHAAAAGVLGGLSMLSGVYSAAPVLALAAPAFSLGWRPGMRFLAALAAMAGGGNLLFHWRFGTAYAEQVYRYHFLKPAKTEGFLAAGGWDLAALVLAGMGFVVLCFLVGERLRRVARRPAVRWAVAGAGGLLLGAALLLTVVPAGTAGLAVLWHDAGLLWENGEFERFLYFHPHLLLAPGVLAVAAAAAWASTRFLGGSPQRPEWWLPAACGLCLMAAALAELALLKETYSFYYVLVIPGAALALGSAWSVVAAGRGPWAMGDGRWTVDGGRSCPSHDREGVGQHGLRAGTAACTACDAGGPWVRCLRNAAALALLLAVAWAGTAYIPVGLAVGESRFPEEKAAAGRLVCYRPERNVNTPFSEFVTRHFLSSCRFQGSSEPGVYHYLWKKKWHFSRAEEIAAYIEANSGPDETVLGSSLLTPLLALLSHRAIAADLVDTNTKRITSGMLTEQALWEQACRTPVRFLVAGERSYFEPRRLAKQPFIRKYFKPVAFFNEPHLSMDGKTPVVLFRRVSDRPDAQGRWCGP